jgi:hypothetical protein
MDVFRACANVWDEFSQKNLNVFKSNILIFPLVTDPIRNTFSNVRIIHVQSYKEQ